MWMSSKGNSGKAKCPICKEFKSKLRDHLVRVHKMNPNTAKTIRSRTGQSHQSRQAIKRPSKSTICPIASCGKAVKKPHNHLRDTHKITDPILYKRLLNKIKSQNGK